MTGLDYMGRTVYLIIMAGIHGLAVQRVMAQQNTTFKLLSQSRSSQLNRTTMRNQHLKLHSLERVSGSVILSGGSNISVTSSASA